jgi:hypothetical protein
MLQEDQVTSAPRAIKVSIKTAVWIVMCKHPAIREPASGCSSLYSERSAIKPGISASANSISFLPQAAREMYFESHKGIVVVLIYSIFVIVNFMQNYVISLKYTNLRNIYEMFGGNLLNIIQ